MSEIIQDIASKNQVTFLPLWENLLLEAKKYGYSEITIDGIHLTKYGHQLIAEKWIEKVNLL